MIVQALEELRRLMKKSPYADQVTDNDLRWFLLDRKLDVTEAADKLTKMLRWRREFGADWIETTDIAREAATGKAFLHSHLDIYSRPVIIVRAARHITGAAPLIESQKLCVHVIDRALDALPPNQDTILGIFDLRGFTSKNADLGFVRFLVDVFFTYYPKRLSQVLLVEAPWVFKPGWEMVRPWLKKYQALVRFVSAEQVRKEYFTPETVPEDFALDAFTRKLGNMKSK
jgi:hypothetical protein